jgi:hypothetical protein
MFRLPEPGGRKAFVGSLIMPLPRRLPGILEGKAPRPALHAELSEQAVALGIKAPLRLFIPPSAFLALHCSRPRVRVLSRREWRLQWEAGCILLRGWADGIRKG